MSSTLVLPGEAIPVSSSSRSVVLGPGISSSLSRAENAQPTYIATKMGVLTSLKGKEKSSEQVWVESQSKRYVPSVKELVLGTIIARHAEGYRVDIGSAQMASLDALAFADATKRSKPNLKVGTLVYARVSTANRDMEPEVECFDPTTGKSDGFGELKGGVLIQCSLRLCRQLLNPKFVLLPTLAGQIPFETAIGLNGRIWVKAGTVAQTIALKRVVEDVDGGELEVEQKAIEKAVRGHLA
ncbi:exosome complex component RRP40, partial [Tremellales sp. Uapishka_1]